MKARFLVFLTVPALLLGACGGKETQPPGVTGLPAEAAALAAERGLTPDDVYAALKTYMPTGELDPYIMFASGGQSGQVLVIGVPSMRILRLIGVFTPESWQGYGFGGASMEILAGGDVRRRTGSVGRHPPPVDLRDRRRVRRPVPVHQRQGQRPGGGHRPARLRDQADPAQPERHQRPRRRLRHAEHRVRDRGPAVRRPDRLRVRPAGRVRVEVPRHDDLLGLRPAGRSDRSGQVVADRAAALLAGSVRRRQGPQRRLDLLQLLQQRNGHRRRGARQPALRSRGLQERYRLPAHHRLATPPRRLSPPARPRPSTASTSSGSRPLSTRNCSTSPPSPRAPTAPTSPPAGSSLSWAASSTRT